MVRKLLRNFPIRMSGSFLFLTAALIFVAGAEARNSTGSPQLLQGEGALNHWTNERPGNRYLIKPADLPKPYATDSAPNESKIVPRPANAWPKVPEGFKIDLAPTGLGEYRALI